MSSPSAAPTPTMDLTRELRRLGLIHTAEHLDDLIARATRSRLPPRAILEQLVRTEVEDRGRRSLERRLKRARLGRFKPMADWEWDWPKSIDRRAVERVLSLDFLSRGENILIVGAQGLGKSMIAKNVAHEAVLSGRSALFTTASDMILDLGAQDSARALERRFRHYVRPSLLVVDEIGYLAYDSRAADLLFQIVSRRYEQRSIIVTTNLAFKQWDSVFPNASCAVALVDRLTHHSEIVRIDGKSYRRREAEGRYQDDDGDATTGPRR
jgi:DNA replication protein DnaC